VRLDQPTFVRWLIDNCRPYANSPLYPSVKDSIDHFRKVWFFNPLNAGSMRLTKTGFQFCTINADIEQYRHEITEKIMPKTLLQMEKYLPCPYFVFNLTEVRIFDQETSVMLTLYNNDLQKYLDYNDQVTGK